MVEAKNLGANVKEGDLIKLKSLPKGLQAELLDEKTENIKERAKAIKEQPLRRNQ
jgi:dihydroxyacid dehydratase/phosphogluconate dehydratase